MKKIFSFLVLIFSTSILSAQESFTIKYDSYFVKRDTASYSNLLYLCLAIKDSQSFTYYPEIFLSEKIGYPLGSAHCPKSTYFNVNKKLLIDLYGFSKKPKTYKLIVYKYPENKWEITKEKKIILGDTCIQAKGIVRGREIIAYYSPGMPKGFGPYFDVGLPGTVLETYDLSSGLHTVAFSIERSCPDIVEPNFAKRVSGKRF